MLTVVQHELKYYFKNKQEAIYIYSFIASILILTPFTTPIHSIQIQLLAPISLWIALTCATALGSQSLFRRDYEQGRLEYYQLLHGSMEGFVLGKWLAFYSFLMLPLAAALPLAGIIYNLSGNSILHMGIGVAAGAAALSILATTISALLTGLEKAAAVVSLIMLPIAVPLLIFGASYTRDLSALWQPNLMFLIGFSAFMLPVMCFGGAYGIRNSH